MKTKKLLILTLVLLSLTSFFSVAQPYTTIFGTDSTKWVLSWCNLDIRYSREQIAKIDTMIEGIAYKKVGTIGGNSLSYDPFYAGNGYVRVDSSNGKVWFMGRTETSVYETVEYLVMDLSLSVNDTFIVNEFGNSIITIVDSVYTLSGQKHVRTNYNRSESNSESDPKLTFIEGVGTNYGFTYMFDLLNICPCLRTYQKDNSEVYQDIQYPGENSFGVTEKTDDKFHILIYPHPVSGSGIFEFENKNGNRAELILSNSLGQTIRIFKTISNQFNFENMVLSGIYFYSLIMNDQLVTRGRISFIE